MLKSKPRGASSSGGHIILGRRILVRPFSSCHVHRRDPQCLVNVCAVTRRRFPVGASPTRQPLQPEATGAVMEVTKWLKPSV